MVSLNNIQTYYLLYTLIQEKTRYELHYIANKLGLSGRGRTKATASKYIHRMYDLKISLRPNLILKSFENCYLRAYFLRVKNPEKLTDFFQTLSSCPHITYMLLLSGKDDFFVTSRTELTFEKGIRVMKKSMVYTPIYTHPKGWNLQMGEAFKKIAHVDLLEGKLERTIEDYLPWEDIHYDLFRVMMRDAQMPFSKVADILNISPSTVKTYYYKNILPYCNIAHYFFPKGYDHYFKSLITLKTDFEKGFINILEKLPCTSYVFPLEDEIVSVIFHEGVHELLFSFKKFEEKGYKIKYLLQVPLHWV